MLVEQNLASTEAFLDLDQAQAHPWPYLRQLHSCLLCILQCPQRNSGVSAEVVLQKSESTPNLGSMHGSISASCTVALFVSCRVYSKSEGGHLELIGQVLCVVRTIADLKLLDRIPI